MTEKTWSCLESQVPRNVLLRMIDELYQAKLSDAIAVKEWLEAKLREPVEEKEQPRSTNSYLCLNDLTRWDAGWSCKCNDRCPNCDAVVEPFATTDNADQRETIRNQRVYDRANVTGR